jgi:hypothetical protein
MDRCTYCDGPLASLGILGRILWCRCISCGQLQSAQVCPDCEGFPALVDEETGDVERCERCAGSGLEDDDGAILTPERNVR